MDFRARRYQTSTLVAAAGCKAVTFRAWRHRHGLFPDTKESGGWNYFSIVDICVVRAVVVMTEHGLPVDDAVWQADKWFRAYFRILLDGEEITPFHGFLRGSTVETGEPVAYVDEDTGEVSMEPPKHWKGKTSASFIAIGPDQSVSELMARCRGALTIIDLRSIISHILSEIEALAPETVATRDETFKLVLSKLADAIRPKSTDGEGEV